MLQPTVLHVAHAILCAMERYRTKHAVVMLLARVLCSEIDEVRLPNHTLAGFIAAGFAVLRSAHGVSRGSWDAFIRQRGGARRCGAHPPGALNLTLTLLRSVLTVLRRRGGARRCGATTCVVWRSPRWRTSRACCACCTPPRARRRRRTSRWALRSMPVRGERGGG